MTPGARLAAAIEVLQEIDRAPAPADAVMQSYFRNRRFIGSKDRAAIAEQVYGIYRRRSRIDWWLARAEMAPTPRSRVMADQALDGASFDDLDSMFDGGKHRPAPLTDAERHAMRRIVGHTLDHPHQPEAVQAECPDWAVGPVKAALGEDWVAELAALNRPAPLDLRVNVLLGDRKTARRELSDAGIRAEPTPWSPWGLRVHGRPPLSASEPFKRGLVEVQDEGSQLLAMMVEAQPGLQVVDFCAGAGGKTLAIAATMQNKGRIVATDVYAVRLDRAGQRLRRAGVHNVERRTLAGERDKWVKRHKGRFDRVLVDAPCSGTGTWRRNPDAKWGRAGPDLVELVALQRSILDSAARLVRPGGRLIYGTCSLLREENEAQVEAFLAAHPDFAVVPVPEVWARAVGNRCPVPGPYLRLSPLQHGTDGFFAAVLQRSGEAAEPEAEPDGAEAGGAEQGGQDEG
ncbi:MAG TPA: RsmB/NOP family class I SAM-dependent RNA methyltransferase [Alphaproteobacteria bacterium]|nr:RsmB/NOP family class I SAM-dependent RNA methyltransferase [Alphaproteobacteria bacterium]